MRIGINALFLIPGEVGGTQTYLCETLTAMRRLFPEDHLVLFTQIECDPLLRNLLEHTGLVSFVRLDFRASNRYARIIREQTELPLRAARERLDVLWSPGYTAPLMHSGPQAVTIYDMQYRRFPEDLTPLARWTTAALVHGAARRCEAILTISRFSKSEIALFTRAPETRIHVALAGVASRFAEPAPQGALDFSAPGPLAAIDGHPFVLCVANTYPHKNVHTLIDAFARLPGSRGLRLLLIGKPRLGEPMVRAALASIPAEARERIVRVETAPIDTLVALYRRCALFAFPTLYEGFGLPLLEAMLAGVPALASNIPALREIGGEWAIYADATDPRAWADAMRGCLECDEGRLARQVAGARAYARNFTWEETARKTRAALCIAAGYRAPRSS